MKQRFLPILDGENAFVQNAPALMLGFMNYPNDMQSAFHFLNVISSDSIHQENGLVGNWSRVAEIILADAARCKNQAHVAGHVALALVEMQAIDAPVSLSRAIEFTDTFARKAKQEIDAKLPVAKRKIREHWNHYMPVAHYWAATIAIPDLYLAATESEEGLCEFLAFAEKIEGIIEASIDTERTTWNPWRVPPQFAAPDGSIVVPRWNGEFKEIAESYYQRNGL